MAKRVEILESWGYRVNPDSKGFLNHRYIGVARWTDIHHGGTGRNPEVPINTFGVKDEHSNMLLIARAYNNSPHHDPRPRSQKIPLRAQLVSYWTLVEQRSPADLSRIIYADVIEETLKGLIKDVYEIMGAPTSEDLMIAQGDPPFATLLTQTPFGVGVKKMLDEYAELFGGKEIESFYFRLKGGTNSFDLIIDLT
ncbi:hypothetical protein DHEL01_v209089 [Diaporthe helianthi]|uniref:Uncharacterized protein n=1 Tax=Diaporthe helianthi TaxID=158607 RepID=A0A2P5HQJ4_DIAHE|nr:hypothetical protein DHEL01_v209089 [Diaporthe helianthi]